jgi:hypothetical protein
MLLLHPKLTNACCSLNSSVWMTRDADENNDNMDLQIVEEVKLTAMPL